MCANKEAPDIDLKSVCSSVQDEGPRQTVACAPGNVTLAEQSAGGAASGGEDTVVKKRKTRRGKSKRRYSNPYSKMSWQQRKNVNRIKYNRKYRTNVLDHGHALAPFNSNQFLIEDHGDLQELDDTLYKTGGAGSSVVPARTRDSSFSVDSDGDFYSSPEDEEEFLTREFDNAYEDLHAERLQAMSKADLIQENLQLESKLDLLTKRLRNRAPNIIVDENSTDNTVTPEGMLQEEINKLLLENDELRRENEHLRNNVQSASSLTSSMDSESDSSSSTGNSSSSSNTEMKSASPAVNGCASQPASPTGA